MGALRVFDAQGHRHANEVAKTCNSMADSSHIGMYKHAVEAAGPSFFVSAAVADFAAKGRAVQFVLSTFAITAQHQLAARDC